MNFDDKRVKEIFLGLILIIVLIILIVLFTKPTSSSEPIQIQNSNPQPPSQITIINSYNTNSFNEGGYESYSSRTYSKKYSQDDKRFKSWSSREINRGLFGNEINRYIVHVENTGNQGKYFRVKFNLEDCYEYKTSNSITKYVAPRDKTEFVYTDIKNQYCDWKYEIN